MGCAHALVEAIVGWARCPRRRTGAATDKRRFVKGIWNINLSRVSFLIRSIVPSRTFLETWPVKDTVAENRIKPYIHEDRIECDLPDSIIGMAAPELLKDKLARKPKPMKTDLPAENGKLGRPRKDAVRPLDLNNNLASD